MLAPLFERAAVLTRTVRPRCYVLLGCGRVSCFKPEVELHFVTDAS